MIRLKNNNFSKEQIYLALRDRKLMTFTIMLRNICNFKCPFCYTQSPTKKAYLETEEIKQLISDGKTLGVRTILIAGAGEPIMAPDFWEVVNFIHDNEMDIVVFSNLSLINDDLAKNLYEKNINIIGKINSFKKDVQEKLVGTSDVFQKMQSGLQSLISAGFTKLNTKDETMLAIETPILPENVEEIFELWKFCRNNNIMPVFDTVLYEGSAKDHDYDSFLVDYDIINKEINKIMDFDKELGITWQNRLVKRESNKGIFVGELTNECHRIGTNLNIDEEGNVYDCFNMSAESYGNIKNKSILQMYAEGKPYKNAINVHGLCQCRSFTDRDSIMSEICDNCK